MINSGQGSVIIRGGNTFLFGPLSPHSHSRGGSPWLWSIPQGLEWWEPRLLAHSYFSQLSPLSPLHPLVDNNACGLRRLVPELQVQILLLVTLRGNNFSMP